MPTASINDMQKEGRQQKATSFMGRFVGESSMIQIMMSWILTQKNDVMSQLVPRGNLARQIYYPYYVTILDFLDNVLGKSSKFDSYCAPTVCRVLQLVQTHLPGSPQLTIRVNNIYICIHV